MDLIEKLKSHIHFEESMDDSMLFFYLQRAEKYVYNAIGKYDEFLIIMIAGIMFEYRVSESELKGALEALTPFFIQEVYADGATDQ